jgi:N-acetylmuramic acid 6-phosphate etherase
VTGLDREAARAAIAAAGGSVRTASVMARTGLSRGEAERRLAESGGHLRPIVGDPPPAMGA